MNHPASLHQGPGRGLKPLLAAALLACAGLSAQATTVSFTGMTDSGPLIKTAFSGSFSYADPAPAFDGSVLLDSFTLDFAGQTYTLASADPTITPVAWFTGGSLLGVDYASDPGTLPSVQMTAGFFDVSEAFFSYAINDLGIAGFGTPVFVTTAAVPVPASLALVLAGLCAAGALARRRS